MATTSSRASACASIAPSSTSGRRPRRRSRTGTCTARTIIITTDGSAQYRDVIHDQSDQDEDADGDQAAAARLALRRRERLLQPGVGAHVRLDEILRLL